jgi:hypothetical protein
MTASSEVPEGVNPATLAPGSLIDVETKSRQYLVECLGGSAIRISGHPEYCLTPVPAYLHGSIEPGMKVTFFLNGNRPVTTSRVVSVHVDQPAAVQSSIH